MLKLDQQAPDFKLPAYIKGQEGDYKEVSLSDYRGKWLVLFFYPRDFTFVCPTEIRGFAKQYEDFTKLGVAILAASTDSVYSHKAWFERDMAEVQFPILADTTHKVTESYDLLREDSGEADRGLFVIDPEGCVKYIVVSDDNVGRSVHETLRVVQALQSGGLCPVDWEPGQEHVKKT